MTRQRTNTITSWHSALICLLLIAALCGVAFAVQPECGNTITSSVTLDSDLFCDGAALLISGDNMLFDCAGHQITYSLNEAGNGLIVKGNNVTISSCVLQQSSSFSESNGISISDGSGNIVTDSSVYIVGDNSIGIFLSGGSDYNKIVETTVTMDGQNSNSISTYLSSSDEITNSTLNVLGNSSSAVSAIYGRSHSIGGNSIVVRGDNSYGIIFGRMVSNTISDNQITVNSDGSVALSMDATNFTVISDNNISVTGNLGAGIFINNGSSNSLSYDMISYSGENGFGVFAIDSPSTFISASSISSEGANSRSIVMAHSQSPIIFLNFLSSSGQNVTTVSVENSSDSPALINNFISVDGAGGRGASFSNIRNVSIMNNTMTAYGQNTPLSVSGCMDTIITNNAMSGGIFSASLSFSSNTVMYGNNLKNAIIIGGSYLLVNNSLLGSSPKISVAEETQLQLNDNDYGNYWGRVESPYFVSGVDVNNATFNDLKPLSATVESSAAAKREGNNMLYPLLSLIVVIAVVFIVYRSIRMRNEQRIR